MAEARVERRLGAILAVLASGCREEIASFYSASRGSSGLASLATFTPKA
jgi:hypothetical protein